MTEIILQWSRNKYTISTFFSLSFLLHLFFDFLPSKKKRTPGRVKDLRQRVNQKVDNKQVRRGRGKSKQAFYPGGWFPVASPVAELY